MDSKEPKIVIGGLGLGIENANMTTEEMIARMHELNNLTDDNQPIDELVEEEPAEAHLDENGNLRTLKEPLDMDDDSDDRPVEFVRNEE